MNVLKRAAGVLIVVAFIILTGGITGDALTIEAIARMLMRLIGIIS